MKICGPGCWRYSLIFFKHLLTIFDQINTNPYLGVANDYIADLLPKMIDDLLELTVDPLFPPKIKPREDRSNGFELIYCESNSTLSTKAVNTRSSFFSNIYPIKELEQPMKKQKPNLLVLLSKGLIETPELEDSKTDDTPLSKGNQQEINVEETYKILKNHLNFKTSMTLIDLEWVQAQILQILKLVLSSENITEKQSVFCCRIMQLISTSPAVSIFVEAPVLSTISQILTKSNTKTAILTAMVIFVIMILIY